MTKITKALFKEALEQSMGTNTDLSRRLHVTPGAITQFLDRYPDMKQLFVEKRLENIDRAELEIFEQLDFDGDDKPGVNAKIRQTAALSILKTLGRDKGWVEKTEQDVNYKGEGFKIIIEEKVPDEGNKSSAKS